MKGPQTHTHTHTRTHAYTHYYRKEETMKRIDYPFVFADVVVAVVVIICCCCWFFFSYHITMKYEKKIFQQRTASQQLPQKKNKLRKTNRPQYEICGNSPLHFTSTRPHIPSHHGKCLAILSNKTKKTTQKLFRRI